MNENGFPLPLEDDDHLLQNGNTNAKGKGKHGSEVGPVRTAGGSHHHHTTNNNAKGKGKGSVSSVSPWKMKAGDDVVVVDADADGEDDYVIRTDYLGSK